ncbi:MAG: DUF3891 family protein [Solirubrobacteraceae bacterium]|nr:DUF3891 family protein [Solirubrobacteraceae bacterium]
MLLRPTDEGLLAIGQTSHAWISGQLARVWGNAEFGAVVPREEICLAAEQHDVGMAEWDRHPQLDPETSRPRDFMHLPVGLHLALWRAAPGKLLTQSAYAALLCSMHGVALQRFRDLDAIPAADADDVRAFLVEQRVFQDRLRAQLGRDEAEVERNQQLIWTWDALSLAICLDWAPYTQRDVPAAGGGAVELRLLPDDLGGGHSLDPWPFVTDTVTVHAEGRILRPDTFADEAELHAALLDAPLRRLTFSLRPRR